jgi:DNA-binding response OmpR family regulator
MKTTPDKNKKSIILLFEDEEDLRRSISFTLMRSGFDVKAYEYFDDVIKIIKDFDSSFTNVSLIITDLELQGKSGLELVRMVSRDGSHIPILIITGHGNREVRKELMRLGITEILDKPFSVEELINTVISIIH